jgi:hypothetical protein
VLACAGEMSNSIGNAHAASDKPNLSFVAIIEV